MQLFQNVIDVFEEDVLRTFVRIILTQGFGSDRQIIAWGWIKEKIITG
jgi:hypothetical protein